jgi:hypothetical protein
LGFCHSPMRNCASEGARSEPRVRNGASGNLEIPDSPASRAIRNDGE